MVSMMNTNYMIVEDGFGVILTPDRSGVSCWSDSYGAPTRMTLAEAIAIQAKIRNSFPDAKIIGEHCAI